MRQEDIDLFCQWVPAKTRFNISIWDIHMLPSPEEAKKLRFKYLYEVYKLALEKAEHGSGFGTYRYAVGKYDVGNKLDLSRNTVDNIAEYLDAEGLVIDHGMTRDRAITGYSEINKIEITHKGIKEIEDAIEKPDSATEHFPPNSITLNITGGQFTNSPFQVASKDSSQNITAINRIQSAELKEIITRLKQILEHPELPAETKQELEAEVQTIESQSKSPKPKIQIIKDALASAEGIIEHVSGVAATAAPLAVRIVSWLNDVR